MYEHTRCGGYEARGTEDPVCRGRRPQAWPSSPCAARLSPARDSEKNQSKRKGVEEKERETTNDTETRHRHRKRVRICGACAVAVFGERRRLVK